MNGIKFDPLNWTCFSSGKILIVRESRETRKQEPKLLSPWADALARQAMQRKLLNMPTAGEA